MSLKETVEILFTATDETGKAIKGVGQGLGDLSAPAADLTKKFLLLEGAILAIGAAFAGKAYSESIKFESSLLELQKVLGDGEGIASDYTKQVDELAQKYGESASSILAGAATFKQAGFTAKEAFELQASALDLVIAGEVDAAQAAELLTGTLKGFKLPASEAARAIDIINEVSNRFATNAEELAIGMQKISPIANTMGFSLEETAGILTPVIEVFRSGSEAAFALKTGLLKLIDDSAPVQDALKKIGVSQTDLNGKLRSGKDILADVGEAFKTAEENDKLFLTQQLVGIHQAGRMVEVFNGMGKSIEVTTVAMAANGSAAKEVAVRLASAEKQIDRARVAFNNMARAIGDEFRVELTGAISGITEIELAFKKLVEGGGLDPFINAITPQLVALEEVLKGIALALPKAWEDVDFSPITDALEGMFDGASSLFDDLDLTKPEDLAKALNGLIEIGGAFISTTEGIASVLGTVGGVLVDVVQFYGSLNDGTQKLIGSIGGAAVAMSAFAPVITAVGTAALALSGTGGAFAAIVAILTGPIGIVVALAAATVAFANWGADIEVGEIEAKIEGLKNSIEKNTDEIADKLASLGFASFEAFQEAIDAGEVFFDDTTSEWIRKLDDVASATENMGTVFSATGEEIVRVTEEEAKRLDELAASAEALGDEWEVVGDKIVKKGGEAAAVQALMAKEATGFYTTLKDGTRYWVDSEAAMVKYTGATKKVAEADKEAQKTLTKRVEALAQFKLGIEEIESKERIAVFELKTEVNLAQIESATKIFESMIGSVNEGIESTGTGIVELFKILSEGGGRYGLEIMDAIEAEMALREKQFALQEELIRAQISLIEMRRESIERGDALINVTAEGLEPHLQEILRSIIEAARLEATASAQELLLGMEEL
jgi:TP901 family phage tail tape measure protein